MYSAFPEVFLKINRLFFQNVQLLLDRPASSINWACFGVVFCFYKYHSCLILSIKLSVNAHCHPWAPLEILVKICFYPMLFQWVILFYNVSLNFTMSSSRENCGIIGNKRNSCACNISGIPCFSFSWRLGTLNYHVSLIPKIAFGISFPCLLCYIFAFEFCYQNGDWAGFRNKGTATQGAKISILAPTIANTTIFSQFVFNGLHTDLLKKTQPYI